MQKTTRTFNKQDRRMKLKGRSVGLYWKNLTPYFFVRKNDDDEAEDAYEIKFNDTVTISIGATFRCIGYWDRIAQRRVLCPHAAEFNTQDASSSCVNCKQKELSFILGRQDAASDLEQIKHVVYLALFGSELIKIGVASERRALTRLVEQGAFAGMLIACTDGMRARDLEREISASHQIPERISTKRKISLLYKKLNQETAESILGRIAREIRPLLVVNGNDVSINPIFHFLYPHYHLPLEGTFNSIVASATEVNVEYSGRVIGVVGQIIVLESFDKKSHIIIPHSNVIGRDIQLSNKPITNLPFSQKTSGQTNMFD